jgi:3-isopropylmalate dehydrogenase
MKKVLSVASGDGVGPEVVALTLNVLKAINDIFKFEITTKDVLVGGAAFDLYHSHLPIESINKIKASDALLFGSVGGPVELSHLAKWKDCERNSILALRKAFHFNVNLRPVTIWPEITSATPLKEEIISSGVDLIVVRELIGDVYFGEHRRFIKNGEKAALDVAEYTEDQIRAVAEQAFEIASSRKKKVCLVHKANVLEISRLWQEIVADVANSYSDIIFEQLLVDNCAIQLIKNPTQFDVILTSNLFGDILSDLAAALAGSIGLLPSASLSTTGFGMFEPAGGSAPQLTGLGVANPVAQILSLGLIFKTLWQKDHVYELLVRSIRCVYSKKIHTPDINLGGKNVSSSDFTNSLIENMYSIKEDL